jgi:hypothetical protein
MPRLPDDVPRGTMCRENVRGDGWKKRRFQVMHRPPLRGVSLTLASADVEVENEAWRRMWLLGL